MSPHSAARFVIDDKVQARLPCLGNGLLFHRGLQGLRDRRMVKVLGECRSPMRGLAVVVRMAVAMVRGRYRRRMIRSNRRAWGCVGWLHRADPNHQIANKR
jgi:hypothetical protein